MQYRREVDGLRALAVVPVLLAHTAADLVPGGFAGVDVFFVISGYLITGLIVEDLRAGRFSLLRFYERRIRRIFPALFAMLALCLPIGFALMLPHAFADLARSLGAAALFLANVHFWQSVDYFSPSADLQPLIHTWSLAVEEQYYLMFPLLLIGLWRLGGHGGNRAFMGGIGLIAGLLAVGASASFALSLWGAREHPEVNFFFTPSRVWELFAGAAMVLLPQGRADRPDRPGLGRQLAATLGLAMIVAGYALCGPLTPFPSAWTLLPVGGAALVLGFGRAGTGVARLLGTPILVGIGAISYSLYLWHQPMLAFVRIAYPGGAAWRLWLALGLCLPLAWASWRWIEQPFRHGWPARPRLFALAAGAAGLAVALSLAITTWRPETPALRALTPAQRQIEAFVRLRLDQTALYRRGECFVAGAFPDPARCNGITARPGSVLLWGDSHAAGLAIGLRARLANFASFAVMRCPIFVASDQGLTQGCKTAIAQVLDQIAAHPPETVILHKNWLYRPDEAQTVASTIARIRALVPDARIVLLGGVPHWVPELPMILLATSRPITANLRLPTDLAAVRAADARLAAVAAATGVAFVPLLNRLCSDAGCLAVVSAAGRPDALEPMAFDYGHLTGAGSAVVAQAVIAALSELPPKRSGR